MIAKLCLILLSSAALLLAGAVFDGPFSNCKTWRTCNKRTEPDGCSISYEYTDCDNIRGVGSASCTNGVNCQSGCLCDCNSTSGSGYTISYYDTCSDTHVSESRYCNGCGPLEQ